MHPRMIYKTFNPELPRQTKCSTDLLVVYSNKQLNRTYRRPLSFVLPCQRWMVLSVTRLLSSEPCNLLCCQQMRVFHVNLRLLSQSQRWTGCDSYIWDVETYGFLRSSVDGDLQWGGRVMLVKSRSSHQEFWQHSACVPFEFWNFWYRQQGLINILALVR